MYKNRTRAGKCRVCQHPQREEIEKAYLEGISSLELSKRYGMSTASISRHMNYHMATAYRHVHNYVVNQGPKPSKETLQRGFDVQAKIHELESYAKSIMEEARNAKRYAAAVSAVQVLTRLVELQAKIAGILDESPKVQVGLAIHPEAMEALKQAIAEAPVEIRRKISLALVGVGSSSDADPALESSPVVEQT